MRYGIIDIGSNSVRLLVSDEERRVFKKVNTTGLGRGLALSGRLGEQGMRDTAIAVAEFFEEAKKCGCEEVYAFATEAVRSASNREEFISTLGGYGIEIDVVDGKDEAEIGFCGAYTRGRCCVMDIGGASTELAVGDSDGLIYAQSVPIGLVRIFDNCGEDKEKIDKYIDEALSRYALQPEFDELLSIGGTASSFVAIKEKMATYDWQRVDNYRLSLQAVNEITEKIRNMSMEERLKVDGLEPKRRHVIVGGGTLLAALMKKLGRDYVIVRESDNQEGYLKKIIAAKKSCASKKEN